MGRLRILSLDETRTRQKLIKNLCCIAMLFCMCLTMNAQGLKTYSGFYDIKGATGKATYTYKDADDGTRIFEGNFNFSDAYRSKQPQLYYTKVWGKFHNNLKNGLWTFVNKRNLSIELLKINYSNGVIDGTYEYSSSQDNVTVRSFKGTFKNGVPIGTISGRFSKGWTFTGQTDENGLPDGLWKASSSFEVQYEKWEHGVLLDSYIIDNSTGDKRAVNESIRQGIQQLIYLNPAFWMTRGSKDWDGTFLEKKKANIDDDNETVFVTVEQMPSFPGGDSALASFLASSINYPPVAYENGVQGRVIVTFVVEKDGSVSNAQIARSVDPSLDKEALRIVRSMPKWNPGKQSGIAVRVKYNVPVVFRL